MARCTSRRICLNSTQAELVAADVCSLIGQQKRNDIGDFGWLLPFVKIRIRHRFAVRRSIDDVWKDYVYADASWLPLFSCALCERNNGRLRSTVSAHSLSSRVSLAANQDHGRSVS